MIHKLLRAALIYTKMKLDLQVVISERRAILALRSLGRPLPAHQSTCTTFLPVPGPGQRPGLVITWLGLRSHLWQGTDVRSRTCRCHHILQWRRITTVVSYLQLGNNVRIDQMTAVRFTAERKVNSIKRSSANTHRVTAKCLDSNSQKHDYRVMHSSACFSLCILWCTTAATASGPPSPQRKVMECLLKEFRLCLT